MYNRIVHLSSELPDKEAHVQSTSTFNTRERRRGGYATAIRPISCISSRALQTSLRFGPYHGEIIAYAVAKTPYCVT